MRQTLLVGACVGLALLCATRPGWAQEEISQDAPPPATVEKSDTPLERSFQRPFQLLPGPRFFPWLKEQLKDAPPFFRDTTLDLHLRSYYMNAGNFSGPRNEAWTGGGALTYQSGWLWDALAAGAVYYTSQALYAPYTRDGTLLLEQNQTSYGVLGQLYAKVKPVEDLLLTLYRSTYDTPYISRNDNRMTPNTFEGYTVRGAWGGQDEGPALRYGGGYITKIKQRNDDEFVWMSRVAGAHADRGVGVAGAQFSWGGFSAGGIDYYSPDVINIGYGEVRQVVSLPGGVGLLASTQFTEQRSVGGNLMKGYGFSTNQFGVEAEASYANAVLTLAYTRDADGQDIQTPWSGTPGYTSVQVQNYKRAGEEAFLVKGSYDFSLLGLPGFTFYSLFVHGWGAINSATKATVSNVNEADVDLQWRPDWSGWKGLWFRARYAHVAQYQGPKNTTNEFRIIVNYDFSLF